MYYSYAVVQEKLYLYTFILFYVDPQKLAAPRKSSPPLSPVKRGSARILHDGFR
jgi:hypothetical protein